MIAILDYGSGNTQSVQNAVSRLGFKSVLTHDHGALRDADKVIFPGVGNAATAMNSLKENQLDLLVPQLTQPVLGICLGLQLMCRASQEGDVEGLKVFDTDVRHFPSGGIVPHMGWNSITDATGTLFEGITANANFYFVHSFAADICANTIARNDYLRPFSAALQKDNFYAVQFHPEKSGAAGAQLLINFLKL